MTLPRGISVLTIILQSAAALSVSVLRLCLLRLILTPAQAAEGTIATSSQDKLIDIFDRIERFCRRLEIYTSMILTNAMTNILVETMVEVLSVLAIATEEVKRRRTRELMSCVFYHSR